ncbi:MAG: tyrosine-type recombinase/integrase [Eubacteriaceae bacterium]|nr:tyrosine-type recombinase/integrase [Eubacteriaceae bacterium]
MFFREIQGRDIQTYDERYVLHIRGTKNNRSDRYVPLDEDLRNTIAAIDPEPYEYISVTRAGNKHDQQSFTRLTERLRHDMNIAMGAKTKDIKYETLSGQTRTKTEIYGPKPLAEDFVPYCLRHTYCTDLKDKGIDIRDAQYLMGHSDISTTANIYTHGNKDTAVKIAGILDSQITTGGTTVNGGKRHKNANDKNQQALKKAK